MKFLHKLEVAHGISGDLYGLAKGESTNIISLNVKLLPSVKIEIR